MTKVSLFARMTIKPGSRDEVLAAFEAYLPTVEAEEGTEIYAFHKDEADENVIWVFEMYRDHAALGEHAGSPAFAELLGTIGGLFDGPAEMHTALPAFGKGVAV